jgi:hypothetical protein
VSKELSADVFRIKQSSLLGLDDPEDESTMIIEKVGKSVAIDIA